MQNQIRRRIGLPPRAVRAGPAERAQPAGAEQLARLGGVGDHRQVQPESAAHPVRHPQERVPLLLVGQPVGAHQPHGLLATAPGRRRAMPPPSSIRAKREVVVGGRPQPGAAAAERRIGDRRRTHRRRAAACRPRRAGTSSRRAAARRCRRRSRCRACRAARRCARPAPRPAACPRSATGRCRARRSRGCRSAASPG